MRGNFDGQNERLAEVLKNHDPYVAITVSTTGLDGRSFDDHRPTAIVVQEYVYSEEDKKYNEGITFNELVKCSPESLTAALDSINNGGYDVFTNSGIDKDAYVRGDNVKEVEEVKKQLSQIFSGMHPNAVYIANNADHCIKFLDRIGCADFLKTQKQNHNLLDQPSLSRQFFKEHGMDARKATLDALGAYLTNAEDYMRTRAIDRFSDVNQVQFAAYTDSHNTVKTLTSGKSKVNVINQFVQFRGRELDYLTQLNTRDAIQAENEIIQSGSESGKIKYRNADFEAKFDTLLKQGVLTPIMLNRDSATDLNRFYDAIEGKTNVKGAVFFQAATTGFNAGNKPIQFTAICVGFENGQFVNPIEKISFNIEADDRDVQIAIDAAKKGQYNTFAKAKIDVDKYLAGDRFSIDEAARRIGEFFQKYGNDYLLFSNGRGKDGKAYTVSCLSAIGNFGLDRKEVLDVADIIKQYCYVAHFNDAYTRNAILDEGEWANKGFGLEDFATARGKEIDGTQAKVILMGTLMSEIGDQYYERIFGKTEKVQPTAEQPREVSPTSATETPKEVPLKALAQKENQEKPYRVIIYSKDKDALTMVGEKGETDREKMRFGHINEARLCAQQALETYIGGYAQDPRAASSRSGWVVFNENDLTIEKHGVFPLERAFSEEVLERNGLINGSERRPEAPPSRERFSKSSPESAPEERFIERDGYDNVEKAIGNVPQVEMTRRNDEEKRTESDRERRREAEQRRPTRTFRRESQNPDIPRTVSPHPIRHRNESTSVPTIVINAFGGAGVGKTTECMHIISELQKRGYTAEYIPNYAREIAYDNPSKLNGSIGTQSEIFAEQQHRIDRVIGKADFVVTDSPLLLQSVYLKDCPEKDEFDQVVMNKFKTYNNFCFVVKRDDDKFEGNQQIDNKILDLLERSDLYFGSYSKEATTLIVDNALKSLGRLCPERKAEITNEIAEHNKAAERVAPVTSAPKDNSNESRVLQTALTGMTEMMKVSNDKMTELMAAMIEQNKMLSDQFQAVMRTNTELLRTNNELVNTIMAVTGQRDLEAEAEKKMKSDKPTRP